jgi:hypothetical protein
MIEKNPLDVLFKDIKRDLWLEEQRKQRAKVVSLVPPPPHLSTYANPLNWKTGRVIELIHQTEGSLGLFQEYFHKLSPTARRLLPAAAGLPASASELVWGEFWLHPKFQAMPEPEDAREIRAIEARFRELMDLWFSGQELPGWIDSEELTEDD